MLARRGDRARARGGALLIPSFAVERTQEIISDLAILIDAKRLPDLPVYINSPLAFKATRLFGKHAAQLENSDRLLRAFASPHVRMIESVDESKALNRLQGFHIVIAASGMCEAGRIRHHLKNRLWQPTTTVLLAGYQAQGTLGRLLQEGVKRVKIYGEEIEVRATVDKIDDYSGHADGPELHAWMKARLPVRGGVFLTHGEDDGMDGLTRRLAGEVMAPDRIFRPALDDCYDISGALPALLPAEKFTAPRPKRWGGLTGTMSSRNSRSTSAMRSPRPRMITLGPLSFESCATPWRRRAVAIDRHRRALVAHLVAPRHVGAAARAGDGRRARRKTQKRMQLVLAEARCGLPLEPLSFAEPGEQRRMERVAGADCIGDDNLGCRNEVADTLGGDTHRPDIPPGEDDERRSLSTPFRRDGKRSEPGTRNAISSSLTLTRCACGSSRLSRARHTARSGTIDGRTFGSYEMNRRGDWLSTSACRDDAVGSSAVE